MGAELCYDWVLGEFTPIHVEVVKMRPPKVEVVENAEKAEALVRLYSRPLLFRVGSSVFRLHPSGKREDFSALYGEVVSGGVPKADERKAGKP